MKGNQTESWILLGPEKHNSLVGMVGESPLDVLPTGEASALQQKLWYGRIPVVFSLHPADVTTLHAPRPFYAMLPRMGYLISQTRAVIEYFRDAAPPMAGLAPGNSIWFEHDGRPLKWHLPCGLLFDLSQNAPRESTQQQQQQLPWRITVHFSGFPADEVLPCENEQVVESHFMHTLKQSAFLRTGSTKLIMGMPEAQQTQIWTSLQLNDYGTFATATRDLQLASQPMKLVPVRLYVQNDPVVVQMPINPTTLATLGDALRLLLPDLFTTTSSQSPPRSSHHKAAQARALTHGLELPTTASLLALYECFAYPDGFLHIAVLV